MEDQSRHRDFSANDSERPVKRVLSGLRPGTKLVLEPGMEVTDPGVLGQLRGGFTLPEG